MWIFSVICLNSCQRIAWIVLSELLKLSLQWLVCKMCGLTWVSANCLNWFKQFAQTFQRSAWTNFAFASWLHMHHTLFPDAAESQHIARQTRTVAFAVHWQSRNVVVFQWVIGLWSSWSLHEEPQPFLQRNAGSHPRNWLIGTSLDGVLSLFAIWVKNSCVQLKIESCLCYNNNSHRLGCYLLYGFKSSMRPIGMLPHVGWAIVYFGAIAFD